MQLTLLLLGLFAGLFWFMRWSLRVGPARTAMLLRWLAVGAIILLLLLVMARGGGALALPVLALLLPVLLRRWRALWPPASATGSSASREKARDKTSSVTTDFLHMSLNHGSGEMHGRVLAGRFQGRELHSLNLNELQALWRECQQDPQSVSVLEAYLDRHHGDWRDTLSQQDTSADARHGISSVQEAYEILGLQPGASEADIKAAHRRLIQRLHPDQGGSSYLAARINWAKDTLLQSRS